MAGRRALTAIIPTECVTIGLVCQYRPKERAIQYTIQGYPHNQRDRGVLKWPADSRPPAGTGKDTPTLKAPSDKYPKIPIVEQAGAGALLLTRKWRDEGYAPKHERVDTAGFSSTEALAVTRQAASERAIEHIACHDSLTGLVNRREFEKWRREIPKVHFRFRSLSQLPCNSHPLF